MTEEQLRSALKGLLNRVVESNRVSFPEEEDEARVALELPSLSERYLRELMNQEMSLEYKLQVALGRKSGDMRDARYEIYSASESVARIEWEEIVRHVYEEFQENVVTNPEGYIESSLQEAVEGHLVTEVECNRFLSFSPNEDAYEWKIGEEHGTPGVRADFALEQDVIDKALENWSTLDEWAAEVRLQHYLDKKKIQMEDEDMEDEARVRIQDGEDVGYAVADVRLESYLEEKGIELDSKELESHDATVLIENGEGVESAVNKVIAERKTVKNGPDNEAQVSA